MKNFLKGAAVLLALLLAAILLVDAYLARPVVDYTLRRGTKDDPQSPPAAFEDIYPYPNKYEAMQPRPPKQFRRAAWTLTSFDGLKLEATHFVPNTNPASHKWAILVHGYGCNQRFMYIMATYYLAHGYQILTPDMRASGKSEGTYLTMGVYEGRDVAQWARAIVQKDPQARIALHGVSMGAADVMLSLNDNLPDQVKAIIEDSGYSNLKELLAIRLVDTVRYPKPVLLGASVSMWRYTSVFLEDVDPLQAVSRSRLPILFIHGTADQLIPLSMMKDLYNASPSKDKAALTVQGATHAMNDAVGDPYYRYVFQFLDHYVG